MSAERVAGIVGNGWVDVLGCGSSFTPAGSRARTRFGFLNNARRYEGNFGAADTVLCWRAKVAWPCGLVEEAPQPSKRSGRWGRGGYQAVGPPRAAARLRVSLSQQGRTKVCSARHGEEGGTTPRSSSLLCLDTRAPCRGQANKICELQSLDSKPCPSLVAIPAERIGQRGSYNLWVDLDGSLITSLGFKSGGGLPRAPAESKNLLLVAAYRPKGTGVYT